MTINRRHKVLGMILAGGRGTRLEPLTLERTKPAVPFGSKYRIIDFALNNMINSEIYGIYVLTQFKAQSLTDHIQRNWRFGSFLTDYFITLAPAQMSRYEELGEQWYRGTADAIYQNTVLISDNHADLVAIFSGDHIYKMDIRQMIDQHLEAEADVTVAAYPIAKELAGSFGILQIDSEMRITEFQEKPKHEPHTIPGRETHALASMGNYIFSAKALNSLLNKDASNKDSGHDFGYDVLPMALEDGYKIQAYDFTSNRIPGEDRPNNYWRDVGTLDAFWLSNMDLVQRNVEFDLYNYDWPLRTSAEFSPPAKFSGAGYAVDSLLAGGVIIRDGVVRKSVLSRRVNVGEGSLVEGAVVMDNAVIGDNCTVKNAIIDKNVVVETGAQIGVDHDLDRRRGFTVTEAGIVVVPKNAHVEAETSVAIE